MTKNILIVIGTRPNFIKVTRFKEVIARGYPNLSCRIVHTGQHYDNKMSKVFFEQLALEPDEWLRASSGSPNTQMASIMIGLEKSIENLRPALIIVVGDVNSTLAAAITANKCNIPLAHVESGLRSRDYGMPEEINRILTDKLSQFHFITESSGLENLKNEGFFEGSMFMVGNTMIDTLVSFDDQIQASKILEKHSLKTGSYILMTMHRPATVDDESGLNKLVNIISEISKRAKVIFPVHPRTKKRLDAFGLESVLIENDEVILLEPMDYFAFQKLICHALCVITDSGGIQEETTYRKIPCLTLRPNTERPITISIGSNRLSKLDINEINTFLDEIGSGDFDRGEIPPLWDGKSTERIVSKIAQVI